MTGQTDSAAERDAAIAERDRLQAEVAALRMALGGRAPRAGIPEPIGCPAPGACSMVAELGRLRAIIRVNGLRHGATHAEVDAILYARPHESAARRTDDPA